MSFANRIGALLIIFGNWSCHADLFAEEADVPPQTQPTARLHQQLPEPLTSFGAAVLDGYLYVFSGHDGKAHGFGKDLLVDHFRRIRFDDPDAEWEELAMHDSAQSIALVSDGKHLYRVGGLSFRNKDGSENTEFDSTSFFARYDIEKNQWEELEPLPMGRSSHDAAVLGRKIYAVGGWNLQGANTQDAFWHDQILVFDLDEPKKGWQEIEGPGYSLRALSVAAHNGKLYAAGGMGKKGFLRTTSIYDPAANSWSKGPDLISDSAMSGFATSMFAVNNDLYCTGASGIVYRLDEDGNQWQVANRLLFPRMFLRLLPAGSQRLLAVGGTGSLTGRTSSIESVVVGPVDSAVPKIVSWTIPNPGTPAKQKLEILDGMRLYTFGGRVSGNKSSTNGPLLTEAFVFDIAKQTVDKLPNLPTAQAGGIGFTNRKNSESSVHILVGGERVVDASTTQDHELLEYDPQSQQWARISPTFASPVVDGTATAFEQAIWIFPGSKKDNASSKVAHSPVLHWWGDESPITAIPAVAMPRTRSSFGGGRIGNEYFIIGGHSASGEIETAVDVFNFKTREWRQTAKPTHARLSPSIAIDEKKLYLFGGESHRNGKLVPCPSLEMYDSETDCWLEIASSVPFTNAAMTVHSLEGRLFFFGNDSADDSLLRFTIFDPEPLASPRISEPMSFMASGNGGDVTDSVKAIMRRDSNKDGFVTEAEIGKRMKSFFDAADKNGDQRMNIEEVTAELKAAAEKDDSSVSE